MSVIISLALRAGPVTKYLDPQNIWTPLEIIVWSMWWVLIDNSWRASISSSIACVAVLA